MLPKIKICGLTDYANIKEIMVLNPDFIGFIFWEKSKRAMKRSALENNNKNIKKVGVFVDADEKTILEKSKAFQLDILQLHGNETPDFCKHLKSQNHQIIKAFSVDEKFNFEAIKIYESFIDYFLFDTKGKLPGGNGLSFDWQILNNYTSEKPYFLSGGIGLNHIKNIKTFLKTKAAKHCEVIDINSQFETSAGIKNINLLKQFIDEIRS